MQTCKWHWPIEFCASEKKKHLNLHEFVWICEENKVLLLLARIFFGNFLVSIQQCPAKLLPLKEKTDKVWAHVVAQH